MTSSTNDPVNRSSFLIDSRLHPQKALLDLLQLLNIPHDGTLSRIIEATSIWCQNGKERWQFKELYPEKKRMAWPILKKLGCIDPFTPTRSLYNSLIFLGGHTERVKRRLKFLKQLWDSGIRFEQIVFLSGARQLDPLSEKKIAPLSTESEMIAFLFEHSGLPKEIKNLPQIIIDAPAKRVEHGILQRPNTQDTIATWMATSPMPEDYLALTCQPFVGYHDACLRSSLPNAFKLETVGTQADYRLPFSVFLYNLRRWLEILYHTTVNPC